MRGIRKDQLTRAAYKCIAKKGFHRTTLEDVANAAGVSKGVALYYFKSKDDLLVSVLERFSERQQKFLSRLAGTNDDAKDEEDLYGQIAEYVNNKDLEVLFEVFLKGLNDFIVRNIDTFKVWLEFWAEVSRSPVIRDFNRKLMEKNRRVLGILLEEGVRQKRLDIKDIPTAAKIILAQIYGTTIQYYFMRESLTLDEMEVRIYKLVMEYLNGRI